MCRRRWCKFPPLKLTRYGYTDMFHRDAAEAVAEVVAEEVAVHEGPTELALLPVSLHYLENNVPSASYGSCMLIQMCFLEVFYCNLNA